jgi:hypothetical protein
MLFGRFGGIRGVGNTRNIMDKIMSRGYVTFRRLLLLLPGIAKVGTKGHLSGDQR